MSSTATATATNDLISIMSLDRKLELVRVELLQLRRTNAQQRIQHQRQRNEKEHKIHNLETRIRKAFSRDLTRRSSLGTYVSTVRTVLDGESQYIQALQGQICRALHMLGTYQGQVDQTTKLSSALVLLMKTQSSIQQEETTTMTIGLLNQIAKTDQTQFELQTAYSAVVSRQTILIAALQLRERQRLGYAERPLWDDDHRIHPSYSLRRLSSFKEPRRSIKQQEQESPTVLKKTTIRAIERFALSSDSPPVSPESPHVRGIRMLNARRLQMSVSVPVIVTAQ